MLVTHGAGFGAMWTLLVAQPQRPVKAYVWDWTSTSTTKARTAGTALVILARLRRRTLGTSRRQQVMLIADRVPNAARFLPDSTTN